MRRRIYEQKRNIEKTISRMRRKITNELIGLGKIYRNFAGVYSNSSLLCLVWNDCCLHIECMKTNTSQNRKGYSLIELMIAIAILGLLLTVAVPSYIERLPERRLSQAAWEVYMDLLKAKAMAVSENLPVEITFLESQDKYTIWIDRDRNGHRDSGEEEECRITDVPTASFTATPSVSTFLPSGTLAVGHAYLCVQIQVPDAGSKLIYSFPNGHIEPQRLQHVEEDANPDLLQLH